MIVRISPHAEAALESIFAYGVEQWGSARAQAYSDELIDAFDRIVARIVPWRPIPAEIGVDGYRYHHGRHVIYWRATASDLMIIALLHDRMDQGARLADALA